MPAGHFYLAPGYMVTSENKIALIADVVAANTVSPIGRIITITNCLLVGSLPSPTAYWSDNSPSPCVWLDDHDHADGVIDLVVVITYPLPPRLRAPLSRHQAGHN